MNKVYAKEEIEFLKESLGLFSNSGMDDFIRECFAYTGENRSYRRDIVTLYIQSLFNDENDTKTQLVEDGRYGKLTQTALKFMMNTVDKKSSSCRSLENKRIEDMIVKILPLWNSRAHDKVIEHFYSFLKIAGNDLESMHLSSKEEWAVWTSQLREETGPYFKTVENLNYSCRGLRLIFGRFKRNPKLAYEYGRCNGKRANQDMIANIAYHSRRTLGNGDLNSGDGLRFKGGGAIQTTGRYNYSAYVKWLTSKYYKIYATSNGGEILTKGYKVLSKPGHSLLSAAYYWNVKKMYKALEHKRPKDISRYATYKVNPNTNSYEERYAHYLYARNLLEIV